MKNGLRIKIAQAAGVISLIAVIAIIGHLAFDHLSVNGDRGKGNSGAVKPTIPAPNSSEVTKAVDRESMKVLYTFNTDLDNVQLKRAAPEKLEESKRVIGAAHGISMKAMRSIEEREMIKRAWVNPRFLDLLSIAVELIPEPKELPMQADMDFNLRASALLKQGLSDPETRPAAEAILVKFLENATVEEMKKAGYPSASIALVAETQAELLHTYMAQVDNSNSVLAGINAKKPSAARSKIITNIEREYQGNANLSQLELVNADR